MKKSFSKKKKTIKILGLVLLIVGITLAAIGLISFAMSFASKDFNPLFFLSFIGLPMIVFSIALISIGFRKEINTYIKNEDIDVVKETYQDIRPEIKDFVDIVKDEKIICPNCKENNDPTSTFCKRCGSKISKIKCQYCHQIIDCDSDFCPKCGNRL